jgi:hypothetical protein
MGRNLQPNAELRGRRRAPFHSFILIAEAAVVGIQTSEKEIHDATRSLRRKVSAVYQET